MQLTIKPLTMKVNTSRMKATLLRFKRLKKPIPQLSSNTLNANNHVSSY